MTSIVNLEKLAGVKNALLLLHQKKLDVISAMNGLLKHKVRISSVVPNAMEIIGLKYVT